MPSSHRDSCSMRTRTVRCRWSLQHPHKDNLSSIVSKGSKHSRESSWTTWASKEGCLMSRNSHKCISLWVKVRGKWLCLLRRLEIWSWTRKEILKTLKSGEIRAWFLRTRVITSATNLVTKVMVAHHLAKLMNSSFITKCLEPWTRSFPRRIRCSKERTPHLHKCNRCIATTTRQLYRTSWNEMAVNTRTFKKCSSSKLRLLLCRHPASITATPSSKSPWLGLQQTAICQTADIKLPDQRPAVDTSNRSTTQPSHNTLKPSSSLLSSWILPICYPPQLSILTQ